MRRAWSIEQVMIMTKLQVSRRIHWRDRGKVYKREKRVSNEKIEIYCERDDGKAKVWTKRV